MVEALLSPDWTIITGWSNASGFYTTTDVFQVLILVS